MASEDAFIAAKSVFMLFYGYVGAVAREIGQEKPVFWSLKEGRGR